MRQLLIGMLVSCALSWISAGQAMAADYGKGLAASQEGNYQEAIREWLPLAKKGHVQAQFNLGVLYDLGLGVPVDKAAAFQWTKMAAEQGDARSQAVLGGKLANGIGVRRDYSQARQWLAMAAEQGEAKSHYLLGTFFAEGKGVEVDEVAAFDWFRRGAELGELDAQKQLVSAYANGRGVGQDIARALLWLNIVEIRIAQPYTNARETLEPALTDAEIVEARQLAHTWLADHRR